MPESENTPPEPNFFSVQTAWIGLEEMPVVSANQFVIQASSEESVISIGYASAPVLVGTPEEVKAQAKGIDYIAVKPLFRFAVTPSNFKSMMGLLGSALEQYEREGNSDNH